MAALPYMQLYVADYLADTAHLNAAQHGAYILLIMNYWQRGKPLRNSNERLASVARMSNEEWQQHRDVIAEFFIVTDDEWVHERIERDLDAVRQKSAKASAAGQASAQRRLNVRSTNVKQTFNHKDTDKDKDIEGSQRRGTRLPADWVPSDIDVAYLKKERPELDPNAVAVDFRDYWHSVAGQKGVKLDWSATWRTWVRRQEARKSNGTTGNWY